MSDRGDARRVWERIAAPGTDPLLLARMTARMLGPRGDPRSLAKEAVARDLAAQLEEDTSPGTQPAEPGSSSEDPLRRRRVLEGLAPPPAAAVMAAAEEAASAWVTLGVHAALVGDPAFPSRLRAGWPGSGAPPLVAWRGDPAGLPEGPAVAIVGARRATSYGLAVAAWLAEAAAEAGVLVVSGGALGVDASAHEAALPSPGRTAAVLGCGHAVAYPRSHGIAGGLFDRIVDSGGWVLSELPPRTRPTAAHVLARNRVVVGLSDAIVVVEGGGRSGTLRTATIAADRGVPVLAVPGDVRAPGSAAPHRLLAEGATPCTGPADLLATLNLEAAGQSPEASSGASVSALPPQVRRELVRSWPRPRRVSDLALAAGVPVGRLLSALTRARLGGEIAESAEGVRLSRAPDR